MLAGAVEDGEGTALGCVGAPRFGKTDLLTGRPEAPGLIDAMLTKGICDVVLIHDVKRAGQPQYDGVPCAGLAELMASPERYNTDRIVFNSTDWKAQPSLNEVCEVAMAAKDEGQSPLVVSDEVYNATNGYGGFLVEDGQKEALFARFLREGVSQRISTAWTTQNPQELPTVCKTLTRAVAQFHLENLAADAASDKFRLDEDGPRVLRQLQRGEFVVYVTGRDWNRTIYGPK